MQNAIQNIRKNFTGISIAFAFWALLIIRFGYAFGTGDQAEFVPYALKIADNSLYNTDLFIQKLSENPVNERIFFCSFLSVFSENMEIACFIGHLIFTVLLVIGLLKISNLYIQNPIFSYAVIFILLIVCAGRFPGGATMYSNSFLSDSVAHAFCAWGFLFTQKNKLFLASLLLTIATLMHPLIGIFVTILSFGGYFLHICIHQKMLPDIKYFIATGIFLCSAGLYLYLLIPDEAKILSEEAYYRIFFELRYPHHTLPSHFPVSTIFGLLFTLSAGLYYFYKKNKTIFYFLLLQAFGFCIYTVGLECFHIVEIGLTQWFRSSLWTYFLGLTAMAALAEKHSKFKWRLPLYFYNACCVFFALVFLILIQNPAIFPLHNNPYEIGKFKYKNNGIVISDKIKNAGLEGTFALPFNFNAFKYYARQSSFADYKTIPRKNANLSEWYSRMNLIYGLDTAKHLYGFEAETQARKYYRNLPQSAINRLKNEGVNYILSDTILLRPNLLPVLLNGNNFVYRIK